MGPRNPTRRDFLHWTAHGLCGAALASLLARDGKAAPGEASGLPHLAPKARRAIHICLCGALSQVDSFDYKPELARLHGRSLQSSERPDVFFGQVGLLRRPDWDFRRHGQGGMWISNLFPEIAQVADELTVINSMVAATPM